MLRRLGSLPLDTLFVTEVTQRPGILIEYATDEPNVLVLFGESQNGRYRFPEQEKRVSVHVLVRVVEEGPCPADQRRSRLRSGRSVK